MCARRPLHPAGLDTKTKAHLGNNKEIRIIRTSKMGSIMHITRTHKGTQNDLVRNRDIGWWFWTWA